MNKRILEYISMFAIPFLIALFAFSSLFHYRLVSLFAEALLIPSFALYSAFGISLVLLKEKYGKFKKIEMEVKERGGEKEANRPKKGDVLAEISILRFNRERKVFEKENYKVWVDKFTTVLDALIEIKERSDPTLSMRYSCRMGVCGSCGMVINGKPSLACETNIIRKMKGGKIEVMPIQAQPLVRDLVANFDDFFEKHKSIEPYLYRNDEKEQYEAKKEYKQSREELHRYLPFSYCIMCGLCLDACPVENSNPSFIGPQALAQVYRYYADSRDQNKKRIEIVDSKNGIWGCEFIGACSEACPKGVDPAYAIQLLKKEALLNED
ncbi:MAG: succinate dehydrogenase iron-sulfur subunit [Candidatus Micrarchaeaceae archaeon]